MRNSSSDTYSFFKLSRDESLVSRDENLVSREGGNLLLSGTVDVEVFKHVSKLHVLHAIRQVRLTGA